MFALCEEGNGRSALQSLGSAASDQQTLLAKKLPVRRKIWRDVFHASCVSMSDQLFEWVAVSPS